jgi:hypothetical protein
MNRVWGWVALIMMVLVAVGTLFFAERAGIAFDTCQTDDRVSAAERGSIDRVARAFISLVRDGDTTSTINSMSETGREQSTRAAIVQLNEAAAQNALAVLQTRRVFKLTSVGSQRGWASCPGRDGVSLVARGGGLQSMFVVLSEPFQTGERSWTLWFEREHGEWRVRGVHLGLSAIGGIDGAQWWRMAAEQRRKDNTFNSTVLYDVANIVLYRGGFLQISEADGFAREREIYRRHEDLTSARLQLGGEVFAIATMNAISSESDGLVLVIDQSLSEPVTVDEAIVRNRALIDAMNAHRPEWREVFDSLAAGAPTGANRLWRTVYRREGGYPPETERL